MPALGVEVPPVSATMSSACCLCGGIIGPGVAGRAHATCEREVAAGMWNLAVRTGQTRVAEQGADAKGRVDPDAIKVGPQDGHLFLVERLGSNPCRSAWMKAESIQRRVPPVPRGPEAGPDARVDGGQGPGRGRAAGTADGEREAAMTRPLLLLEKSPGKHPSRALVEPESLAEEVQRLLGARRVDWLVWGPGLVVAVDEDAMSAGRARNVTLGCVDSRGHAGEALEVSGPLLVCGYDGEQLVSLRLEDVDTVAQLLLLGEASRRMVLWPSARVH